MSYLPQLRQSLVQAAERELPAPAAIAVRRRGFGGALLVAASLAAVVVAGVVLVLVGHRAPSTPSPPATPAPASAQAAAAQVLAAFRPPAGAVGVAGDPTRHHALKAPHDGLPVRGAADIHAFFRVPGHPDAVMNRVTLQRSLPGIAPGAGSSAGATEAGAASTGYATFQLAPTPAFSRELQVLAVPAPGGGTALRVDAVAWPFIPRPASERIPAGADAVTVQLFGPRPSKLVHSPGRLTGRDAAEAVAVLNGLSVVQPPPSGCQETSHFRIRLTFLGTSQTPAPIAVVRPECSVVELSLRGRAQPRLSLNPSATAAGMLRFIRFLEMLEGVPRSTSLASALRQVSAASSSSGSATASAH
jgi:hypothetical protein